MEVNEVSYCCDECNYRTNKKSNFTRHMRSNCHRYRCEYCDKLYSQQSSLSRHKRECECIQDMGHDGLKMSGNGNYFIKKMKQIINGNNITENSHNNNNTIVTNNNSFNLQFFLNDTCKDAMTIQQFVESIVITNEDLERTGIEGYVAGITHIISSKIKEIGQDRRPMHCSDNKRNVFYIKTKEDTWEKENNEKCNLIKLIKYVSNKNFKKINDWVKQYPDCTLSDSTKNDLYLSIVNESMNGSDDEECQQNFQKIILNLKKFSVINKNIIFN